MKQWTKLHTYKYTAPNRIGIDGQSKIIKIKTTWLKKTISPMTLNDFLLEYTYDDAERLYDQYQREQTLNV